MNNNNRRWKMRTSDSITAITPALIAAQQSITFAAKNALNGHLKNTYANLAAVIEAVKNPLNDNGIAFIQSITESDDGKLRITTRLLHKSGEWIEDTASSPMPKADSQGLGSACSYLRRYTLSAMMGVYQDDDDGHGARAEPPAPEKKVAPKPLDEEKMKIILEILEVAAKNGRAELGNVYKEIPDSPEKVAVIAVHGENLKGRAK
jgi:hypothetical protein